MARVRAAKPRPLAACEAPGVMVACGACVQVGIIGLGNMGAHMATNLISKGEDVVVFDGAYCLFCYFYFVACGGAPGDWTAVRRASLMAGCGVSVSQAAMDAMKAKGAHVASSPKSLASEVPRARWCATGWCQFCRDCRCRAGGDRHHDAPVEPTRAAGVRLHAAPVTVPQSTRRSRAPAAVARYTAVSMACSRGCARALCSSTAGALWRVDRRVHSAIHKSHVCIRTARSTRMWPAL